MILLYLLLGKNTDSLGCFCLSFFFPMDNRNLVELAAMLSVPIQFHTQTHTWEGKRLTGHRSERATSCWPCHKLICPRLCRLQWQLQWQWQWQWIGLAHKQHLASAFAAMSFNFKQQQPMGAGSSLPKSCWWPLPTATCCQLNSQCRILWPPLKLTSSCRSHDVAATFSISSSWPSIASSSSSSSSKIQLLQWNHLVEIRLWAIAKWGRALAKFQADDYCFLLSTRMRLEICNLQVVNKHKNSSSSSRVVFELDELAQNSWTLKFWSSLVD